MVKVVRAGRFVPSHTRMLFTVRHTHTHTHSKRSISILCLQTNWRCRCRAFPFWPIFLALHFLLCNSGVIAGVALLTSHTRKENLNAIFAMKRWTICGFSCNDSERRNSVEDIVITEMSRLECQLARALPMNYRMRTRNHGKQCVTTAIEIYW